MDFFLQQNGAQRLILMQTLSEIDGNVEGALTTGSTK